jgi:enediyne polyketide synthase
VRDHFINKITPEYFSGSGKQGELRCILCKVNHLNEAMPFERIGVRMYRTAIFERGVKLYFDYYRVDPHGKRKKLGYGEHEAIWFTPTGKNKWEPSSLPEAIRDALLPKEGADELEPLPRSWSTEKREI